MGFRKTTEAVTVYKAAYAEKHWTKVLIQLRIPAGVTYYIDPQHDKKHDHIEYKKCRAERAEVLNITTFKGGAPRKKARSFHNTAFVYEKGKTVEPKNGFSRIAMKCDGGIHFFFSKKDAKHFGEQW